MAAAGYVLGTQLHYFWLSDVPISTVKADHRVSLVISGILFFGLYLLFFLVLFLSTDRVARTYAMMSFFCPIGAATRW